MAADLLVGTRPFNMSAGAVHVFRRELSSEWAAEAALAGYAARGILHPPGRDPRGERRARGRRRAPRRLLRGNRPPLPARREWRQWRQTAAVTDSITAVLPAVAGGEVKCQSGKARDSIAATPDLVSFLPHRPSARSAAPGSTTSGAGPTRRPAASTRSSAASTAPSFVDVTDPDKPAVPRATCRCTEGASRRWRDMKVYNDHAFIVADGARPTACRSSTCAGSAG